MNVNGKYLKDESGNIISPITSAKTVFDNEGNSLDYTKAYFMSVLASDINFTINKSKKINFTSKELYKNISLNNGTFTFSEPGIYLVNAQFHTLGNTTELYRALFDIKVSNIQGSYADQLNAFRPIDSENMLFRSDANIVGTWIMSLRQGCTLEFYFYPINVTGGNTNGILLKGRGSLTAGTNDVFTYVYIIKLSDF